MNKQLLSFVKNEYSQDPNLVDRLFISAYLKQNNLKVKKNIFLKSYIITLADSEEYHGLNEFIQKLEEDAQILSIEDLIKLFEFVVSPEDRIVNGAVYTPGIIREFIIKQTIVEVSDRIKIADIACGCGGFLLEAAKKIRELTSRSYSSIFSKNLFGLDIQSYSINRTKLLLTLLALESGEDIKEFQFNLFVGDALDFKWKYKINDFKGFTAVVGNPPYVCSRNFDEQTHAKLKNWSVSSSGHPDLYIPFFQIGLENLIENGILGFITMNSFFKSVNGRALRKYFEEKLYQFKILDFGNHQVFKSRSTYTCICLITKSQSDFIEYTKIDADLRQIPETGIVKVYYDWLSFEKGWNLTKYRDFISKIESIGTPFSKRYKTRNGIATLKNKVYIFKPEKADANYYYLEDDDYLFPIEKDACRSILNPNILASSTDVIDAVEKIIFPYNVTGASVEVWDEDFISTNYPMTYAYLKKHKSHLATRDKGKGKNYKPWYIYGRNQSLEKLKYKLFFPHITPSTPYFYIDTDDSLLFYNGIAVIGANKKELQVLEKIMSSRLFWFYIENTSKPYSSSYYSLSKNYIKDFGIYPFSKEDVEYLLKEVNQNKLDKFIESKYKIDLNLLYG